MHGQNWRPDVHVPIASLQPTHLSVQSNFDEHCTFHKLLIKQHAQRRMYVLNHLTLISFNIEFLERVSQ